jgi:hypothetical protein
MTSYINPEIISKLLHIETAMTQYGFGQTPECDGSTQCGQTVGVACDSESDAASAIFFLPGADLEHEPNFCNITGVADFSDAPQEVSGTNCTFSPVEACEGGAVWQITCQMPDDFCDPSEINVDCGGAPSECSFVE